MSSISEGDKAKGLQADMHRTDEEENPDAKVSMKAHTEAGRCATFIQIFSTRMTTIWQTEPDR